MTPRIWSLTLSPQLVPAKLQDPTCECLLVGFRECSATNRHLMRAQRWFHVLGRLSNRCIIVVWYCLVVIDITVPAMTFPSRLVDESTMWIGRNHGIPWQYTMGYQIWMMSPHNYQLFLSHHRCRVSGNLPGRFRSGCSSTQRPWDFWKLCHMLCPSSYRCWYCFGELYQLAWLLMGIVWHKPQETI